MKRTIYKLGSSAKYIMFAFALIVFSTTAYAQATYTFNYTGNIQTVTLTPGSYSIECWGALGGWHASDVNTYRGKGGYSTGTITLTATTTLYIGAGGAGGAQINNSVPGGWNGGGDAKYYTYSYNGGGGASHVATLTGTLGALSSNTSAVLIVAGGGGGGCTSITPGNGGGLNGGNSTRSGCTGGTQTTPGASSIAGGNAVFGRGWDGTPTGGSYGAGGGGWYGGGCESAGSGFVGGMSTGTTISFGQTGYVANPDISGNGMVIIRELCSVKIASSSGTVNPTMLCSGTSLTLTTDAISNYSWSTGATTSSIVVAPTSNTMISVTGTSSMNCTSTGVINILVNSGVPVLSIANPSSAICLGKTVSLTASGAINYTWTNAGVVNGQTFTPTSTTVYTVTGQNGCGISTANTTITVAPLAVSILASSTLVCQGSPATLTAVAVATTYTWLPSALGGSTTVVGPIANSVYTVAVSDGTCAGTQTIAVATKITPTVNISSTASVMCVGDQIVMTASGANNYTWMPGNQSGNTVTVSPSASTVYVVTGENLNNCSAMNSQIVLVEPSPTINVTASKLLVCAGQTVYLSASGGNGYQWTGGPGTYSTVVTPNSTTVYTVTGTHTLNTCTAAKTITISAVTFTLTLPTNTEVCLGGNVTVYASGATSYVWNSTSTGNLGVYTLQPPSTTTVTLVATTQSLSTSCPVTHTFQVLVNPLPSLTVTATRAVVCKNETNTLTVTGAQTYTWTSTAGGSTFTIKPGANTTYSVAGTDGKGCVNTFNYQAKVNPCIGIGESTLNDSGLMVYPNPNNGIFTVKAESAMDLILVNELGQELRKFTLSESANFSFDVKDLKPGVYFIHTENPSGGLVQKIVVN